MKHVIATHFWHREKGLQLPGNGTFRDLQEAMVIRDPEDLWHFLQPFLISTPCIAYVMGPHFTYKSRFIGNSYEPLLAFR
jgi:hypothetical protein